MWELWNTNSRQLYCGLSWEVSDPKHVTHLPDKGHESWRSFYYSASNWKQHVRTIISTVGILSWLPSAWLFCTANWRVYLHWDIILQGGSLSLHCFILPICVNSNHPFSIHRFRSSTFCNLPGPRVVTYTASEMVPILPKVQNTPLCNWYSTPTTYIQTTLQSCYTLGVAPSQ